MEKTIPGFSRYTVDENGVVRKKDPARIIEPEVGRRGKEFRVAIINDSWKVVRPKVSRLVLMTFHPVENKNYDWITASYKDGNHLNTTLANLEWDFEWYKPPIDGFDPTMKDVFVPIPGFSNYEVSPSGIVRNTTTHKELTFSRSSVSYLCCRITNDDGLSTYVGLHHLMARALLTHPKDVDQLVINHKDGIKIRNELSNLEWVSYSSNIHHAYYTGLRTGLTPVFAKKADTGEVLEFLSIGETARFFGNCNPGKIHGWLYPSNPRVVREGWFISSSNIWK